MTTKTPQTIETELEKTLKRIADPNGPIARLGVLLGIVGAMKEPKMRAITKSGAALDKIFEAHTAFEAAGGIAEMFKASTLQ